MPKFTYLLLFIVILFFACDELSTSVYPLSEEDFSGEMEDSIVMFIDSDGSSIELTGTLDLIEGQCDVWLTYPIYDSVFNPDTLYLLDTLFSIDSITLLATVDSIFISDTIFTIDTILNVKTTYSDNFTATDKFEINEKFDRIKGEWIFYYQLKSLDEVEPSGSFDFKMKYND